MEIKLFKATMTNRNIIAKDTLLLTFDFDGEAFHFLAGQYVRITIPSLITSEKRGNTRDFSIASSPTSTQTIFIAARISQSAFKQTLLKASLGLAITIEGPFGVFTLPEDTLKPLMFVSGGIGITPFFSMIQFVTEKKLPYNITLLYSNHSLETSVFLQELQNLTEQNESFSFTNHIGHVDETYIKSFITSFTNKRWYIAGPPGMVFSSRQSLMHLGVEEEAIRTEDFTGY